MYIGLKQLRGDGERYVTPAQAAAKETNLHTDWDKIGMHNNRRNNNFMIFQRSRLKWINDLFENHFIN